MKYIRKFETIDESNLWREGQEWVKPNVALVAGEVGYNYSQFGIFIQHIDGSLYSSAQWSEKGYTSNEANGVAVLTAKAQFVIAKGYVSTSMAWSSDTSTLVSGLGVFESDIAVMKDYDGRVNTQLMLTTDTSGAGFSCANFLFPNGNKGYLPAAGELYIVFQNKSEINSLMKIIGGESFLDTEIIWSSSQRSATGSWIINMKKGSRFSAGKADVYYVRAFAAI